MSTPSTVPPPPSPPSPRATSADSNGAGSTPEGSVEGESSRTAREDKGKAPAHTKCATAILAEGAPGMPTLAQLQAQLTPEAFTASLRTVMAKRGVKIQARYVIDDNEISLYDLYQTVLVVGGGVEQVDYDRAWPMIASRMNLSDDWAIADQVAGLYHDVLATYEDIWSNALLRQRALFEKRAQS